MGGVIYWEGRYPRNEADPQVTGGACMAVAVAGVGSSLCRDEERGTKTKKLVVHYDPLATEGCLQAGVVW